jgi:AcrR family transcriptional regulator
MSRPSEPVKTTRRYDATRRREQARQTRERIVRTAEQHFLRDGYVATSVAAIAAAAKVSVDTIYKSFGGKPGLILAIVERGLVGDQPIPAEQRSDRLAAEETDPRKIIAGWGALLAEVSPRVSPIMLLVREAAWTHPELRTLLADVDASRLRRMRVNAKRLHDAGHLRPGITVAEAADVLWTYSSAEIYDLLVLRRHMTVRRFGEFAAGAMIAALL